MERPTGEKGKGGSGEAGARQEPSSRLRPFPPFPLSPFSPSAFLDRAVVVCLFLFAAAAPHSIAGTQTAWLLAAAFSVARYFVRPRPAVYRTPLDYALL